MALGAGLFGAPSAGLVLKHMNGLLGMAGWHWLFLVGGLPCIALGGLVYGLLTDRIQDAQWLTPAEQQLLSSRIAEQNRHIGNHSLLGALKSPGFLMLGLIYFLIQITVSPVMVGRIKDLSGSTTPALYVIAALSLLCAAILPWALPAGLKHRETR